MSQMSGENDRSANVVLTADVDGYRQSIQAAAADTTTLTQRLNDLSASLDRVAKSAGNKLQIFGAGTIAGLAGATAAAAAFEHNVANLAATAAVTGRSFDAMTGSVNKLRQQFPITTSAAAQLVGTVVKMQDGSASVDRLTQTFVKLGAATGESTQGLSTSMLQLQRTMGTSQKDTERYSNALTVLAQRQGVSAQGILDFSQSIAPMAKVAGMSQQAVMGVSSAFLKAGQDGYVAGNAFNKMLGDIMQSVTTGNGDLAKYSNLIGVTVEQFQKMDKTKAITEVFDQLNRMGPNAISLLNRMGFDGIRTIKSITAMSQQTGGIGSAIAESMGAYQDGMSKNSALNKGSQASMGGLINELTKMKNTFAEIGETIGSVFLPGVTAIVKGVNTMARAFEGLVQMTKPFLSIIGAIGGLGAGAAGGLLKIVGPLMSIAAGVALLRNMGTGGLMSGLGRTKGFAGLQAYNYAHGNMNMVGQTMFRTGDVAGRMIRFAASGLSGGRIDTARLVNGLPAGGPGLISRVAGVVPWAIGAGARFAGFGLQALIHPFDAARRATMTAPGANWRESMRNTYHETFGDPTKSTTWAQRQAITGVNMMFNPLRTIQQRSYTMSRLLGLDYKPSQPEQFTRFGNPFAGFSQGVARGVTGLASFVVGLGKATVGLSALTAKTALGAGWGGVRGAVSGGLAGLGSMALTGLGGLGSLIFNPMALMMIGGLAYSSAKGSSKMNDYDRYVPVMDTYARAVGDATSATASFADAMKAAVDSLPKQKTREQALTISPREAEVANASGYQYNDPRFKNLPLPVLKAFAIQRFNDPQTSPGQIQQMALDLQARTGDSDLVTRWLHEANRAKVPNWASAFTAAFTQHNGWWAGNSPVHNKNLDQVKASLNELAGTDKDLVGKAQGKGDVPGRNAQLQTNAISMLDALGQVAGITDKGVVKGPIGSAEMDVLNEWFNKTYFGGQASVGTAWANMPGGFGDYDIDLYKVLGQYNKRKGGGVAGVLRELVKETADSNNKNDDHALAQRLGISTNQLNQLNTLGYYAPEDKYGHAQGVPMTAMPGGPVVSFTPHQMTTYADLAKNRGIAGQLNVDTLMKDYLSPEEKFRKRWSQTDVGKLIAGNSIIEKALKPNNSDNANVQIAAVEELTRKMRDQGWSWEKINQSLQDFEGVVSNVSDPLYGLAEGARASAQALNDFSAHFMSPGFQMQNAVSGYFGTVAANPGNDPESQKRRQDAQSAALGAAMQGIDFIKSAAIQQREYKISRHQARDDYQTQVDRANEEYNIARNRARQSYNRMRHRSEQEFQISRNRAEQSFSISRNRSELEYKITRQRAQVEYNISRQRSELEFNISKEHSQIEFGISQQRALEEYNISRKRAELSFQISMADAEADYRKQRLRAEQDFNHQVELMVKQSAQNMMNVFQRTAVQRTWSASGLLANAQDQLKRMQEQAANLSKLKGMGISTDVVQQLDLTNPNNAQQLARLVQDMAQDPQLVKQFNDNIAQRITAAGALVKNSDNAAWQEMQYQYQQQQSRTAEDFQTSIERSRRDFTLQMKQQAEDMSRQINQSNADFARQMKWSADAQKRQMSQAAADYKRQMTQMAADHKRQTNQAVADFNRSMNQALADHKRQLKQAATDFKISQNQMSADHTRTMDNMLTDFNKMMTRQGNQMARSVRDMSKSIGQIFTSAANQLPKSLQAQLKAVKNAWDQLDKLVGVSARDTRLTILHEYGFALGQQTSAQKQNAPNNNSQKPGVQGGVGGGGGGTVRPEKLGNPVAPVIASENKVTTHFGAKGSSWASGTHTGNDYGYANSGDPIFSVLPGTVVFAGWNGPYGNMVKVNHGKDAAGETVETWYAHMSKILSHKGQQVGKGEKIGLVGETGNAHGAHLHLELRLDGKAVNPDRLWQGLKVTGGNFAGGGVPLPDKWSFEDFIAKHPVMNKMLAGNIVSKTLNDTVLRWAKGMGIDLTALPTAGGTYTGGGPLGPVNTLGNNPANQKLAQQMAATMMGWTGKEWQALLRLWTQESHFQTSAYNPSGATGIPQSLPGSKMATEGADWKTNPATQIRWGLKYIRGRYGDPLTAWAHEQSHNWYGNGAIFSQATKIGVGERGPEAVFPLNEKGADFMATLLNRFGVDGREANKQHVCGTSVPMSNTVYNYKIDSSSNFHGAITVQAQNPNEMAAKLAAKKRRAALTNPMKSR